MLPGYGLRSKTSAQRPAVQEARRLALRDGTTQDSTLAECRYCHLFFKKSSNGIGKHEDACKYNSRNIQRRRLALLQANSGHATSRTEGIIAGVGKALYAVSVATSSSPPLPLPASGNTTPMELAQYGDGLNQLDMESLVDQEQMDHEGMDQDGEGEFCLV